MPVAQCFKAPLKVIIVVPFMNSFQAFANRVASVSSGIFNLTHCCPGPKWDQFLAMTFYLSDGPTLDANC